jgi:glutathione S-transferase
MSMKFYNADLSSNALRVRAVANELGVELEYVDVDLRKRENRSDSFLAINPNGKVPALVDGDFVLWESRAITAYLATLYPAKNLYPDNARKRAVIDQWSYWQAIHLGPAMQRVVFEQLLKSRFGMGPPDEKAIENGYREIALFMPVLEANLAGKDWVAGGLSIADFAVATTFVFRQKADISLDGSPNVSDWIKRMEARPSWQKAVAPVLEFAVS